MKCTRSRLCRRADGHVDGCDPRTLDEKLHALGDALCDVDTQDALRARFETDAALALAQAEQRARLAS